MGYTNTVNWEPLRTLDSSTMVSPSTYYPLVIPVTLIGPLLFPSYKLKLVNNSNVLVTISINGTSDIDVAPANSFWLYDETQASISTANVPAIPKGTTVYCKSASAGVGTIYLVSQYLVRG